MRSYFVIVALILLATSAFALTEAELNQQLQSQNTRYVAAEVAQEIRAAKEEIIQEVEAYNDENFRIFDARMDEFLADTKIKVALGAIGAGLIANALAAYLVMRTMKRYSYETYQDKFIGKLQNEIESQRGMEQMQQPEWTPQQPANTMGMVYGQAQASEMSQMNAWQAQPAYDGSWQSPVQASPDYSHVPASYKYVDDPMQSPQWDPREDQQQ